MPEYLIEHRESFNKPYLKVLLKNNDNLATVQTLLSSLKSVQNVNITENNRTDITVYPSKFYEPKETESEVRVQLDSFYSSKPLDPVFEEEKISRISKKAYDQILQEIQVFGKNLEKLTSLHFKFDEEGFRDFFIPHLNSISKSHSATGETFNKKGKTDILIQDGDGNNAFIAECKIWHGEKELQNAVDQLIDRYVSWRDEHTALIFFNKKNDNFTQLVATARQAIENHELFVKKINDSSVSSTRYIFKNREDEEKHIQLELIVFNCKE
tara:strand:+ start:509 stop:1315 length:807 start_codon:yes stop_codon:yes gene_type:complete